MIWRDGEQFSYSAAKQKSSAAGGQRKYMSGSVLVLLLFEFSIACSCLFVAT
jgi:hypothetical protein